MRERQGVRKYNSSEQSYEEIFLDQLLDLDTPFYVK